MCSVIHLASQVNSLGSSERINPHIHLACALLVESSVAFGGVF